MPLDYSRYLPEIHRTCIELRRAMNELESALVRNGFPLTPAEHLEPDWMQVQYKSGRFFFGRLWQELEKALEAIEVFNEPLASSKSRESQIAYDEVALRQRKLFEALSVVRMLARPAIYAGGNHKLYFLHYHLLQDRERLSARNLDLREFLGANAQMFKQ